jgi:hypothetical protein
MVYLRTLSVAQTYLVSNDRINNELERIWKETVETKEPHERAQSVQPVSCRDLKLRLPEYKAGMLITRSDVWW